MTNFYLKGARDCLPLMIGAIPFGISVGVYTVKSGFSLFETIFMSVAIFAGASQVAVTTLLVNEAPAFIIILTACLINLRFVIYGALYAPYFSKEPLYKCGLFSYLITDHSVVLLDRVPKDLAQAVSYAFGVCVAIWLIWQISVLVGVLFGEIIPSSLRLDFALPLVFAFFMVAQSVDIYKIIAAVTGFVSAVILVPYLPFQSGLMAAIILGGGAGYLTKKKNAHG